MRLFSIVFLLFVLLPSLSFADCANNGMVKKRLISNIPKNAIVRFNGVPPQSTRIAVLEFKAEYQTLIFRDIALQR